MMLWIFPGGILGFTLWYFYQRRNRLNSDREQHHLASLIIACVYETEGVSPATIAAYLKACVYTQTERHVRISHAVGLAKASVTNEKYMLIVQLARRLSAGEIDPETPAPEHEPVETSEAGSN